MRAAALCVEVVSVLDSCVRGNDVLFATGEAGSAPASRVGVSQIEHSLGTDGQEASDSFAALARWRRTSKPQRSEERERNATDLKVRSGKLRCRAEILLTPGEDAEG